MTRSPGTIWETGMCGRASQSASGALGPVVPVLEGGPGDGDARRRPGGLDQAGAVEAVGAGAAVHVGLAELRVGGGDGLVRLRRRRTGVGDRSRPLLTGGAAGAAFGTRGRLRLLRGGEAVERRLAAGEQLVQRGLLPGELRA